MFYKYRNCFVTEYITYLNIQERQKEIWKLGLKNTLETIKNGKIEESAVAAHVWKEKHAMDHKPVLLKQASNKLELKTCKNILITKKKD